jgi:hypothetical protein
VAGPVPASPAHWSRVTTVHDNVAGRAAELSRYGADVTSMGAASYSAADAGAAGVTLPVWLLITLAVIGALQPFVGAYVGYLVANRTARATDRATDASRAATREEHEREIGKGNRELLMRAIELSVSDNETERRRAMAIFSVVAERPDVDAADARLCRQLRVQLAGELSGVLAAQIEHAGEEVVLYVDSDMNSDDDGAQAVDPGQTDADARAGEA